MDAPRPRTTPLARGCGTARHEALDDPGRACAGVPVSPPPADVRVECPPIRTWTPAEQTALAAALSAIPEGSVVWVLERDWQSMRDAARACKKPSP